MAAPLITADSSVVVPLVSVWHDAHVSVAEAGEGVSRLPAHVAVESISVLTRLPGGFAVTVEQAIRSLRSRFPGAPLALTARQHIAFFDALADASVRGGQIYDALVAFSARKAGARLLTRDRRAERTYRAVGVDFEMLD